MVCRVGTTLPFADTGTAGATGEDIDTAGATGGGIDGDESEGKKLSASTGPLRLVLFCLELGCLAFLSALLEMMPATSDALAAPRSFLRLLLESTSATSSDTNALVAPLAALLEMIAPTAPVFSSSSSSSNPSLSSPGSLVPRALPVASPLL
jgi:hypothetical protein